MNAQINNPQDRLGENFPRLVEDADIADDAKSEYSEDGDTTDVKDPRLSLLEDLQGELNGLTLEAETILSHQSRHTQLALSSDTWSLFEQYKQFGSMARLRASVEKFLRAGDSDGTIKFIDETKPALEDGPDISRRSKRPAHYGEAFMLNNTADDDEQKFDPNTAFVTRYIRDPFDLDPTSFESHPLRTVDPDSIPLVTTLPWDPIATKLTWPGRLLWPRGTLGNVNKILSIVDEHSRMRLFHHVCKWGPSPVFRAGIAEHVKALYSDIFQSAARNELGFTPETRSFLRSIYFQNQHLNVAEKRLLALACRIDVESVTLFWEDMFDKTKGYQAMRIFMAAREMEKLKEYADEVWEKRRREQSRQEVDRALAHKAAQGEAARRLAQPYSYGQS
jgi:hypothetical protein